MARANDARRRGVDVVMRGFARMLGEGASGKLRRFHLQHEMQRGGCLLRYNDRGPAGEHPPIIPYAPMTRSRVYTGTRETGSYNHHSQIVKFKGRYYVAWSNGVVDEEAAGQRMLVSSSEDAVRWSDAVCIAGDPEDLVVAHNCVAMQSTPEKLYVVGMREDTAIDASLPGMRRIDPGSQVLSVYASSDGQAWEEVFTFSDRFRWIFEAPRETADGHLLCVAALKDGAAILRWPGTELCEHPEVIDVPQPHGARFPYGEGTWYQTDEGTIVVFWRDEGHSCRAWVNTSDDNGKTFTTPAMSDIPDSMSRLYAGRLADGRYYLCNNAFPTLLNRMHLMLLLSTDGYGFDDVYLLVDDPTSQRVAGLLKEDGYQYPCCLPDGDRLLVGYSVNKEDIECGVLELSQLPLCPDGYL